MPSVKSYQNRKHEIEVLKNRAEVLAKENREALQAKDEEIARLSKDLQVQKCQFDLTSVNYEQKLLRLRQQISGYQYADKLNSSIIDAQTSAIRELERKVRIYRDYIRNGEAFYPEHCTMTLPPADLGCALPPPGWTCTRMPGHDGPCAAYPETIEVPSCLKPLDALKFVGKKITDGPDNLSQELS